MFKSMSINLLKKKTDLLSQSQSFSDPVGIRTQDPQLRRLLLYPAELPNHRFCECKDINFIDTCVKKYLFFILILSRYKSMVKMLDVWLVSFDFEFFLLIMISYSVISSMIFMISVLSMMPEKFSSCGP